MRWLPMVSVLLFAAAVLVWGAAWGPWFLSEPPRPLIGVASRAVQARKCVDCHEEVVEKFAGAPHQVTLRPGADPAVAERFAGRTVAFGDETYRFDLDRGTLQFTAVESGQTATIDWVFGSGNHALTPVILTHEPWGGTAMIEAMATWYADDQLDLTPGTEDTGAQMGELGRYHDFADTVGCFECHSSYLPIGEDRIDVDRMHPGVSCARCHLGAAEHAETDGEQPTQVAWSELSALASISRCGECHRRADEFTADELVPENQLLIRFAPVSMSQSACFQVTMAGPDGREGRRLDCLTCHDPHQVTNRDPQFYVTQCLACHHGQQGAAPDCGAEPMTSQCLDCHMPKVPVSDRLRFTDHWIRVRTPQNGD